MCMSAEYNTRLTLIQRAQNQDDEKAWSEFCEIYKGFIFIVTSKMGIFDIDCEDIVQQVMVKVWKKLPEFQYDRDRSHFRTWLSSITHKTVVDFIRKQTRAAKRHEKAQDDYLSSITVPEVEEIAEKEWQIYVMKLAMERISECFTGKAIEVFLKSMQGMSGEQISEELCLPLNTVYTFRSRVKKRLNEEMKQLRSEIE